MADSATGRVDHPLGAVTLIEAVGDSEHTAGAADIFSHDDHGLVLAEGEVEGIVERLGDVANCHSRSCLVLLDCWRRR